MYKKIFNIEVSDQSQNSGEKPKDKEQWQKVKYVDERTSLLSGQFQQEKYPDEQEGFTKISKYDTSHIESKIHESSGIYDKMHDEA
jgi:hypothetical protein